MQDGMDLRQFTMAIEPTRNPRLVGQYHRCKALVGCKGDRWSRTGQDVQLSDRPNEALLAIERSVAIEKNCAADGHPGWLSECPLRLVNQPRF